MLDAFFDFVVGGGDAEVFEVIGEGALRLGDAHAVVVEDDQQLALERAGVVEAFKGQAVDDGGIADEGDDRGVALEELIGAGHADGGGDGRCRRGRRRRGRRAIRRDRGSRRRRPFCGGWRILGPAGEQLVRVALVAHIPQQAVVGKIEDDVQGQADFDGAEIGRQVPAVGPDGLHDEFAHFLGEGGELIERDFLEVGGGFNRRKEGGHVGALIPYANVVET